MDFGKALEALKQGKRVSRQGWHKEGMWLELQRPDIYSKMTMPYIFLTYFENDVYHKIPWTTSQSDVLIEDWFIKED